MKKLFRSLLLLSTLSIASTAFAASDSYLKIESSKGEKRVVRCADGACTVSDLAPGDYTVTCCTADGKALTGSAAVSHEIKSPRDLASGQATGKRMHKPFTVTKEWSASSPSLRVNLPEQDCPLVLQCSSSSQSGVKSK